LWMPAGEALGKLKAHRCSTHIMGNDPAQEQGIEHETFCMVGSRTPDCSSYCTWLLNYWVLY
jgi:hypothetical protein